MRRGATGAGHGLRALGQGVRGEPPPLPLRPDARRAEAAALRARQVLAGARGRSSPRTLFRRARLALGNRTPGADRRPRERRDVAHWSPISHAEPSGPSRSRWVPLGTCQGVWRGVTFRPSTPALPAGRSPCSRAGTTRSGINPDGLLYRRSTVHVGIPTCRKLRSYGVSSRPPRPRCRHFSNIGRATLPF